MDNQNKDKKQDQAPSEAEKLDEELEKEESGDKQSLVADVLKNQAEEGTDADKSEAKSEPVEAVSAVEPKQKSGDVEKSGAQQAHSERTGDASGASRPDEPSNAETSDKSTPGKWYVVHTYAGHENKVSNGLKQKIESEHLENKIFDILVPTQDKIEIRAGKKETVKEKIFPGYILIKMELDDISWLAVRTTPGVTSFVGMGNKPTPISEAEVKSIVQYMSQGAPATFKDVFLVDDTVKIIDGPFSDFIGKVDSVDKEKGKVRILVSIFGRETPVELDFLQVQKL